MTDYDPVTVDLNRYLAAEDLLEAEETRKRALESAYWEQPSRFAGENLASELFTDVLSIVASDWDSRRKSEQIADLVKSFRANRDLWVARRMRGAETHQGISLLMKQAD